MGVENLPIRVNSKEILICPTPGPVCIRAVTQVDTQPQCYQRSSCCQAPGTQAAHMLCGTGGGGETLEGRHICTSWPPGTHTHTAQVRGRGAQHRRSDWHQRPTRRRVDRSAPARDQPAQGHILRFPLVLFD